MQKHNVQVTAIYTQKLTRLTVGATKRKAKGELRKNDLNRSTTRSYLIPRLPINNKVDFPVLPKIHKCRHQIKLSIFVVGHGEDKVMSSI